MRLGAAEQRAEKQLAGAPCHIKQGAISTLPAKESCYEALLLSNSKHCLLWQVALLTRFSSTFHGVHGLVYFEQL